MSANLEPLAIVWLDSDADLMELFYGLACSARDAVNREGGQVAAEWDPAFERARDRYHAWLDRWVNRQRVPTPTAAPHTQITCMFCGGWDNNHAEGCLAPTGIYDATTGS